MDHAVFIIAAYGFSFVVITALTVRSLLAHRKYQKNS